MREFDKLCLVAEAAAEEFIDFSAAASGEREMFISSQSELLLLLLIQTCWLLRRRHANGLGANLHTINGKRVRVEDDRAKAMMMHLMPTTTISLVYH